MRRLKRRDALRLFVALILVVDEATYTDDQEQEHQEDASHDDALAAPLLLDLIELDEQAVGGDELSGAVSVSQVEGRGAKHATFFIQGGEVDACGPEVNLV